MTYLSWIVFGLIAGFVAYLLDANPQEGSFMGAAILGILGAVVGGMIADLLLSPVSSGFNIMTLVIALAGALMLTFVSRVFKEA
jgi:uncharacterized membrane protein YeaQ/YmgE (transglycosylase-associated protein family)